MNIMLEILPYLLNALLYGALAWYFWRTRWSPAGATSNASAAASLRLIGFEHYLVLVPLGLHTALLARAAFAPDGLHLGVGNAVSAISRGTGMIQSPRETDRLTIGNVKRFIGGEPMKPATKALTGAW